MIKSNQKGTVAFTTEALTITDSIVKARGDIETLRKQIADNALLLMPHEKASDGVIEVKKSDWLALSAFIRLIHEEHLSLKSQARSFELVTKKTGADNKQTQKFYRIGKGNKLVRLESKASESCALRVKGDIAAAGIVVLDAKGNRPAKKDGTKGPDKRTPKPKEGAVYTKEQADQAWSDVSAYLEDSLDDNEQVAENFYATLVLLAEIVNGQSK